MPAPDPEQLESLVVLLRFGPLLAEDFYLKRWPEGENADPEMADRRYAPASLHLFHLTPWVRYYPASGHYWLTTCGLRVAAREQASRAAAALAALNTRKRPAKKLKPQ